MARIIKKKRRRGGAAKKAATKVKVITRRVVEKAKSAYRSGRAWNVSKKDIVLSVAGAGAGAVAAPLVVSLAEGYKVPSMASSAIVAAIGGFAAYKGLKKKNMIITGAGMGMAASGAATLISSFMKKDSTPVSGPIAAMSYRPALPSIPMAGAYSSSTMGASFRDAIITDEVSEDEV